MTLGARLFVGVSRVPAWIKTHLLPACSRDDSYVLTLWRITPYPLLPIYYKVHRAFELLSIPYAVQFTH